jgi:hypothetical protein
MTRPAYGGRQTCESLRSIDVRRWHREGRLKAGELFATSWSCGGEEVGRVFVRVEDDAVILITARQRPRGKPEPLIQRVPITRSPCHLGGSRLWFHCQAFTDGLGCGRRVAILYDGGHLFACRHCCRLAYTSQHETPLYRSMRRARKIRARLGASPSLADALPTKPKGMHASTYRRLLMQAESAEASLLTLTKVRFGPITGSRCARRLLPKGISGAKKRKGFEKRRATDN